MSEAVERIENAVVGALAPHGRVVLAVSGGRDSMVMLDAAAQAFPGLIVATFDHGTGSAATAAARLVKGRCAELGLRCVARKSKAAARTEARWREQRWAFLRAVADDSDAIIATAHTRDDQVETVFIRLLRDTGARGLAGLYAHSDVVRPLLSIHRHEVAAYALARSVAYADDPSNLSRAHMRNRVRLDILPAIARSQASFADDLFALSRRAADWRESLCAVVDAFAPVRHSDGSLYVATRGLEAYDERELAVLWPEIAARAGVTMDRRGTERLAAFTMKGATGGSIQLSGGIEVVRTREHFILRPARP